MLKEQNWSFIHPGLHFHPHSSHISSLAGMYHSQQYVFTNKAHLTKQENAVMVPEVRQFLCTLYKVAAAKLY